MGGGVARGGRVGGGRGFFLCGKAEVVVVVERGCALVVKFGKASWEEVVVMMAGGFVCV